MILHVWLTLGSKIHRDESGMVVTRDWKEWKVMGTQFQLSKIKMFWCNLGNGCIIMSMYLMSFIDQYA